MPISVSDWLAKSFMPTPTHTAVNVTDTSGLILAVNEKRRYLLIQNDSDAIMYLGLGAAAVENKGIRLAASGGEYEMSLQKGNLYTGAIYAIHVTTGNKVALLTEA